MFVHQKEIREDLMSNRLNFREVYFGSKSNSPLKLKNTNKNISFAEYVTILEVEQ